MTTSTSHWEIEGELLFRTGSGADLSAHGVDLALDREAGVLSEVRLTFRVPPEVYARIEEESLFHLEPESRGPGAGTFSPESDVQIEARLDSALLPGIALFGEDIVEVGPRFSALAAGSPLLETESWYALHVTIEVLRDAEGGSLREGYSTLHAAASDNLTLPMLAIAAGALEERGLDWQETSDDEVIRAEVEGENGSWACFVVVREKDSRCTVYSQAPFEAPGDTRPEMSELLTRVNFGLPIGNFEMDYADGEIRFKTSMDLSGARLTASLFEAMFEANMATMDLYLPALEAVRDGRMTPRAAVEMVEQ